MITVIYSVLLLLLCCVSTALCGKPKVQDLGGGHQKITLKSANLTEEETHSPHMPSTLKCDACRVIAYQLSTRFDKLHQKMKSVVEKKGRLKESDVLDLVEAVCDDDIDVFNSIGVKEVDGENRLSGPGLETDRVAGMMQGGGKWPNRLKELCSQYAGEIGEEEIYAAYLRRKPLDQFLCRGTGLRGYCNVGTKKKKSQKREL